MANLDNTPKFLNGREWRTFLAELHCALPYPRLVDTLKSGHAWVSDGAAQTSNWLLAGLTSLRRGP